MTIMINNNKILIVTNKDKKLKKGKIKDKYLKINKTLSLILTVLKNIHKKYRRIKNNNRNNNNNK